MPTNFDLPLWLQGCAHEPFSAETPVRALALQLAARAAREANLQQAQELYRAAFDRGVRSERAKAVPKDSSSSEARLQQEQRLAALLSEEVGICSVAVQPLYSTVPLLELQELRKQIGNIRVEGIEDFPSSYKETVPGGLLFADVPIGSVSRNFQQIYANGLIYDSHECAYQQDNSRILNLQIIASRVVLTLRAAQNLYRAVDFKGELAVVVALDGVGECSALAVHTQRNDPFRAPKQILLSSYRWERAVDGATWGDNRELQEFAIGFISEICWGLGQGQTERAHIEASLREIGLLE